MFASTISCHYLINLIIFRHPSFSFKNMQSYLLTINCIQIEIRSFKCLDESYLIGSSETWLILKLHNRTIILLKLGKIRFPINLSLV